MKLWELEGKGNNLAESGSDHEAVIGARLAELRAERGISQQQLVERMKALGDRYATWRQSTVYKIEHGKRPLRVNEVFDIADVLGVTPRFFLLDELAGRLDLEQLHRELALVTAGVAVAEKDLAAAKQQLDTIEADYDAANRAVTQQSERLATYLTIKGNLQLEIELAEAAAQERTGG